MKLCALRRSKKRLALLKLCASKQEEATVIALINFASVILFPAGRLLYRGKKGRRRRWKGEKRRKGEGENSKGRRGEDGKVRR